MYIYIYIIGAHPAAGESIEIFCTRRNRKISLEASIAGATLSDLWALKTVTWLEHLKRHPASPAAQLIEEQTPAWLETLRILSGRYLCYPAGAGGLTGTRSGAGQPVRYLGRWWECITFDNPEKRRSLSQRRAGELKLHMQQRQFSSLIYQ